MNSEHRYAAQIRRLIETGKYIHQVFSEKRPVDKALTAYFREHKKFGSKDRRLISSAIFGFYRWYGWLKALVPSQIEKAYLFGYLLDDNEITPLIEFWCKTEGLEKEKIEVFKTGSNTVVTKEVFLKDYIPGLQITDLNPDFVTNLSSDLIEAFQSRPATWLRVTRSKKEALTNFLKKEGMKYSFHPTLPNAVAIHQRFNIHSIPLFKSGDVEIQDITSQAVGEICEAEVNQDIWWDACAGAGGKALHLADLTENKVKILATDIRKSAHRELEKRVQKGGWSSITPILWDGKSTPNFQTPPNKVLVDAPCSCSGTWRRSPDIRWSHTQEDVMQFSSLQFEILDRIAKMDLPIETIFYATCSILKEENEDVVSKFLEHHPHFKVAPILNPFSGQPSNQGLHLLPPEADGIGMYIVKLTKV